MASRQPITLEAIKSRAQNALSELAAKKTALLHALSEKNIYPTWSELHSLKGWVSKLHSYAILTKDSLLAKYRDDADEEPETHYQRCLRQTLYTLNDIIKETHKLFKKIEEKARVAADSPPIAPLFKQSMASIMPSTTSAKERQQLSDFVRQCMEEVGKYQQLYDGALALATALGQKAIFQQENSSPAALVEMVTSLSAPHFTTSIVTKAKQTLRLIEAATHTLERNDQSLRLEQQRQDLLGRIKGCRLSIEEKRRIFTEIAKVHGVTFTLPSPPSSILGSDISQLQTTDQAMARYLTATLEQVKGKLTTAIHQHYQQQLQAINEQRNQVLDHQIRLCEQLGIDVRVMLAVFPDVDALRTSLEEPFQFSQAFHFETLMHMKETVEGFVTQLSRTQQQLQPSMQCLEKLVQLKNNSPIIFETEAALKQFLQLAWNATTINNEDVIKPLDQALFTPPVNPALISGLKALARDREIEPKLYEPLKEKVELYLRLNRDGIEEPEQYLARPHVGKIVHYLDSLQAGAYPLTAELLNRPDQTHQLLLAVKTLCDHCHMSQSDKSRFINLLLTHLPESEDVSSYLSQQLLTLKEISHESKVINLVLPILLGLETQADDHQKNAIAAVLNNYNTLESVLRNDNADAPGWSRVKSRLLIPYNIGVDPEITLIEHTLFAIVTDPHFAEKVDLLADCHEHYLLADTERPITMEESKQKVTHAEATEVPLFHPKWLTLLLPKFSIVTQKKEEEVMSKQALENRLHQFLSSSEIFPEKIKLVDDHQQITAVELGTYANINEVLTNIRANASDNTLQKAILIKEEQKIIVEEQEYSSSPVEFLKTITKENVLSMMAIMEAIFWRKVELYGNRYDISDNSRIRLIPQLKVFTHWTKLESEGRRWLTKLTELSASPDKLKQLAYILSSIDDCFEREKEYQGPEIIGKLDETKEKIYQAIFGDLSTATEFDVAYFKKKGREVTSIVEENFDGSDAKRLTKNILLALASVLVIGLVIGLYRLSTKGSYGYHASRTQTALNQKLSFFNEVKPIEKASENPFSVARDASMAEEEGDEYSTTVPLLK